MVPYQPCLNVNGQSIGVIIYHVSMTTIDAAKLKPQVLALLDHLAPEGVVITKRGRP